MATGRRRYLMNAERTRLAQAFSPDGRYLALCDFYMPMVWLWDMATGAEPTILLGSCGPVSAVAISPDGTTLAATDFRGTVTFWDFATLKVRPQRLTHNGVRSLAFLPDGRALATGGFDGTVHIWDLPLTLDD
jgi:WD40 repeat protein